MIEIVQGIVIMIEIVPRNNNYYNTHDRRYRTYDNEYKNNNNASRSNNIFRNNGNYYRRRDSDNNNNNNNSNSNSNKFDTRCMKTTHQNDASSSTRGYNVDASHDNKKVYTHWTCNTSYNNNNNNSSYLPRHQISKSNIRTYGNKNKDNKQTSKKGKSPFSPDEWSFDPLTILAPKYSSYQVDHFIATCEEEENMGDEFIQKALVFLTHFTLDLLYNLDRQYSYNVLWKQIDDVNTTKALNFCQKHLLINDKNQKVFNEFYILLSGIKNINSIAFSKKTGLSYKKQLLQCSQFFPYQRQINALFSRMHSILNKIRKNNALKYEYNIYFAKTDKEVNKYLSDPQRQSSWSIVQGMHVDVLKNIANLIINY